MKRIAIIACMVLCVVLGACSVTMVSAEQNRPVKIWLENTNSSYDVLTVVDEETGVNYIIFRSDSKAGMTVRLNKDGTPYVSEVNND